MYGIMYSHYITHNVHQDLSVSNRGGVFRDGIRLLISVNLKLVPMLFAKYAIAQVAASEYSELCRIHADAVGSESLQDH